jgi:hypothetical protein
MIKFLKITALSGAASASLLAATVVFNSNCGGNKVASTAWGLGLFSNGAISVALVLKEFSSSKKEEDDPQAQDSIGLG